MQSKLEIAFVEGNSFISRAISFFSKRFVKNKYQGDFNPSHVFLVFNDEIIFESSTYKQAGENNEKVMEKGTRVLTIDDRAKEIKSAKIKRTIITDNLHSYIALKYVAKASNYKYSYSSIFRFLFKGRFKKVKKEQHHDEYICSGLVLEALREPYFKNHVTVQKVVERFKNIDSNTVTPLDLFLALCDAGFIFKTCKGLQNNVSNL